MYTAAPCWSLSHQQETPPRPSVVDGGQPERLGENSQTVTAVNKHMGLKPLLPVTLTMLEQALANVMYLGLNCRQQMGPVCLPSNNATFIPLSAFHTWIFPSSEPER